MATTRKVILIGTAHRYQESGKPGANELKAFAQTCCGKVGIRAIGEEMSEEALKEKNVPSSVGADLARTLEIPHRFCDPDRHQRARIGISQENNIRAHGYQQNWSEDKMPKSRLQSAREKNIDIPTHRFRPMAGPIHLWRRSRKHVQRSFGDAWRGC
jgi:hypothetical protein